jgi:DNA-binding NarL/FixJ family response regulator
MPISLLIADEYEVVRAGIKSMLARTGITVISEATTGKEAVQLTKKHKPDVALLGIRMPDGDGLNTLGRIRLDLPEQPVLMFSSYDNPSHVARAVALGANGFLQKTATREELVEAIRTAAAGKNTWTREGLRRVSGSLATPRHSGDIEVSLTGREFDVLKHICDGLTNNEIALELEISYETVKEHVKHTLRKLGVSDRTQAAVLAVRKGLV